MKAKTIKESFKDVFQPKPRDEIKTTFDTVKQFYRIANGLEDPPGAGTHNYEDENGDTITDDDEIKAIDALMFFYNVPDETWRMLGCDYVIQTLGNWESSDGSNTKDYVRDINDEIEPLYDEMKPLFERGGGGAGYAVWGGGTGRSFGNPSMGRSFGGRGFGFGQSSSSGGGPNVMYTYSIKPLNQVLEPEASNSDIVDKIYPGTVIKAKVFNEDRYVIGQVQSIEEDGDGNISSYTIMDPSRAQPIKVDPTSAFIWEVRPEGLDFEGGVIATTSSTNEMYVSESISKK